MALRDHLPPPPLEELSKIQLMRTMLVKFIDQRNFEEIVQGCFVRVLLEMKRDNGAQPAGPDQYYIAQVKGAKEGPPYSGFSWERTTTRWHIIIELPPCFRSTPNGNVVQLNSVSNTPFKRGEYEQWVEMVKQAQTGFIQIPQIQLRLTLLDEHRAQLASPCRPGLAGRRGGGANGAHADDEAVRRYEEKLAELKVQHRAEIRETHFLLPREDHLDAMAVAALLEVERECLDRLSSVRLAINERTKCRLCREHVCTVVCYPCRHQVLCRGCADSAAMCPVCGQTLQDKFEAFSS